MLAVQVLVHPYLVGTRAYFCFIISELVRFLAVCLAVYRSLWTPNRVAVGGRRMAMLGAYQRAIRPPSALAINGRFGVMNHSRERGKEGT